VPGYREEKGVKPDSRTETFVALKVFIDNWRWAGVPFFLRTGKRLPKRASEISVHLKAVPPILFNADPAGRLDPNVLSIRVQPDEGFSLGISSKIPGPRVRVYPVKMDFHYGSTFGGSSPEAYERLLLDVMAGDPTLFTRRGMLDRACIEQHGEELVKRFDVRTPSARTLAGKLSGGNIQKMILARELCGRPQVLIAGQPTRGLDVSAIEYVHGELMAQRAAGVAVLLISTELDEVLALSDRIAVIFEGRIVATFARSEADIQQIGLRMAGRAQGTPA
jgi:ABC-type sugar transport system ATPase subunit